MQGVTLSLFSGAIGALVATFITLFVEGSREKRRQKLGCLAAFVSNRNDILGDDFSRALNGVQAAFPDDANVLRAREELFEALMASHGSDEANRRLIALWREMSKSAHVDTKLISDAEFLRVMNPR